MESLYTVKFTTPEGEREEMFALLQPRRAMGEQEIHDRIEGRIRCPLRGDEAAEVVSIEFFGTAHFVR